MLGRFDYMPFGNEIPTTYGGRSGLLEYLTNDTSVRQMFTGKERDLETGLDYFSARYNSASAGRFSSPDPLLNASHPLDPQSWNKYTYVLNNPLRTRTRQGCTCGASAQPARKSARRIVSASGTL
jgi:RHS repeat-associated protein